MNIKRNLLTILFLTFCTIGMAQEYKKDIETEFTKYLNSIVNMEFDKSVGYITPEFFEIVSKSQMIKLMEQTFHNPEMQFKIKNPQIIKINDSKKIDDRYYSLLTYSNQMDIKFNSEAKETEEEKETRINLTKLSLERTFGAKNVKYNKETGTFEIQSQKDVYAISKNGNTDWKFLVIERNQKLILDKILPEELLKGI